MIKCIICGKKGIALFCDEHLDFYQHKFKAKTVKELFSNKEFQALIYLYKESDREICGFARGLGRNSLLNSTPSKKTSSSLLSKKHGGKK